MVVDATADGGWCEAHGQGGAGTSIPSIGLAATRTHFAVASARLGRVNGIGGSAASAAHEVSILIAPGLGLFLGSEPRAKISMTRMAEPQQGQDLVSGSG
jgi:hypothetical protein